MNTKEATLNQVAFLHLGFPTLEMRGSGRLDFRILAVWDVKAALEAAYQAGLEAGKQK